MIKSVIDVKEKDCSGCGACFQICPKHCIEMRENKRGFLMPVVDAELCIDCGCCTVVCPEKSSMGGHQVLSTVAAITKDASLLYGSTSGGVFGTLANQFIDEGGAVYGCAWTDEMLVEQIRVTDRSELKKLRQSKYVQANTKDAFSLAKSDLQAGRIVLFSGTACQIAGLKKYLSKDYGNLLTVEVACHGVPSPGLFRRYISYRENKDRSKITEFQFRNKVKHKKGEHYKFFVRYENGREKYFWSNEDPYYGSFLEGRTLRETCYHCRYKGSERVADVLLSDYWGIEIQEPDFPWQNGASAVMLASQKAEKWFQAVSEQLEIKESSFDKVVKYNSSIVKCASCSEENRLAALDVADDELFGKLKPDFNLKRKFRNMLPESVKYRLKKILR